MAGPLPPATFAAFSFILFLALENAVAELQQTQSKFESYRFQSLQPGYHNSLALFRSQISWSFKSCTCWQTFFLGEAVAARDLTFPISAWKIHAKYMRVTRYIYIYIYTCMYMSKPVKMRTVEVFISTRPSYMRNLTALRSSDLTLGTYNS